MEVDGIKPTWTKISPGQIVYAPGQNIVSVSMSLDGQLSIKGKTKTKTIPPKSPNPQIMGMVFWFNGKDWTIVTDTGVYCCF